MRRATNLRFPDKGPGVVKSTSELSSYLETAEWFLRAWQGDLRFEDRLDCIQITSQHMDFGIGMLVSV